MFVPATPAPPAPEFAPVGVVTAAQTLVVAPARTSLKVRRADLNVLDNHSASVAGKLLEDRHSGRPGRLITLQALGRNGWRTVASTRTRAHGRFRLSLTPRRLGSRLLRLHLSASPLDRATSRRLGRLNVYRVAVASWYGGGGGLACGGSLTSSTMGVANKTLPCGTLVTLRYGGHTVRVPVVDRGPFVAGREYDLTEATKRALGFEGVGPVWATS